MIAAGLLKKPEDNCMAPISIIAAQQRKFTGVQAVIFSILNEFYNNARGKFVMKIVVTKQAGVAIVLLQGRMDAVTSREFDQAFDLLIQEKALRIVLNFKELEYISSAGLRSVLAAGKKIRGLNGKLALCQLNGMVKDVFEISGFANMLQVFDAEKEAINGVA